MNQYSQSWKVTEDKSKATINPATERRKPEANMSKRRMEEKGLTCLARLLKSKGNTDRRTNGWRRKGQTKWLSRKKSLLQRLRTWVWSLELMSPHHVVMEPKARPHYCTATLPIFFFPRDSIQLHIPTNLNLLGRPGWSQTQRSFCLCLPVLWLKVCVTTPGKIASAYLHKPETTYSSIRALLELSGAYLLRERHG